MRFLWRAKMQFFAIETLRGRSIEARSSAALAPCGTSTGVPKDVADGYSPNLEPFGEEVENSGVQLCAMSSSRILTSVVLLLALASVSVPAQNVPESCGVRDWFQLRDKVT